MIKLIRFGLFVVIIIPASILLFGDNSNWGSGLVLIGLVLDFCLYTYSIHSDEDSDFTENRFKVSLVSYIFAFFFILYTMSS